MRKYNYSTDVKLIIPLISIIFYVLLSLSVSAIDAPTVYVNETGNITSITNPISGNMSLDDDYEYRAFSANIGNYSYYNSTVPLSADFLESYDRSFNSTPFIEEVGFYGHMDKVTIQYNLTSNFSYDTEIEMMIPLPDFCDYVGHSTVDEIDDFEAEGNNLSLYYHMAENSDFEVNVTCRSDVSGIREFKPAIYHIAGDMILPEYRFNVLPHSRFSTEKERVDEGDSDGNSTWRMGFDFISSDTIPMNITNIKLWATPEPNTTGDPAENIIFEHNYSQCINDQDTEVEYGDVCEQEDIFDSEYVPVIWSEISYDVIWDFDLYSNYTFQGSDEEYDFDFFIVELVEPENDTYADFEKELDMEFNVTTNSTCRLYSNVTGEWSEHDEVVENVEEGNFSLTTFNHTGSFVWNVFCEDEQGRHADFAENNFTVNVNKLQENIEEFDYLEWDMNTNYTLNMSDHFWDHEGDELTYTHEPDPVNNITFVIDNTTGEITLVPDTDFFGDRTARIISTDPFNRNVSSDLFLMNVTASPEITYWNITNGTWWTTEDDYDGEPIDAEVEQTLNFTSEAEHPAVDGSLPNSWFYWMIDGVVKEIGKLFSWYIDFVDFGMRNVTLVVNDTQGMYDMQSWMINVSKTEQPPHLNEVPDQYWMRNTTHEVNLSDWLYDPYMEDHNFTFNHTGDLTNLTVDINNDTQMMTITPDTNWTGVRDRWMMVTATNDINLSTTTNNFSLTVYPSIINDIPNVTFYTNLWNDTINLSENYNDDDYLWNNLKWGAYADNLSFMLDNSTGTLNITSIDSWTGNQTVEMRVHNENITTWNDTAHFNVEALYENYPPVINDTNYTMMQKDPFPSEMIDLWEISEDPVYPHEELSYSILNNSNESILSCEIVENRFIDCEDPIDHWGNVSLNVSVSDGYYDDTANLTVFVEKFIHPPDIDDWTIEANSFSLDMDDDVYNMEFLENDTLDFWVNATDIENRTLNHHWWKDGNMIDDGNSTQLHFDFHSSGNYTIDYMVNNSDGGEAWLQWNLTVVNLNRPPSIPNLTHPYNDTFHTDPFEFNWTNSTDPDAGDPDADDFWEVSYILQASRNRSFRNPELEKVFVDNETSYMLDKSLPDGRYYWRILAHDGADSASSEIWEFVLDMNPPDVFLDITPEVAEFGIRDVNITWSVWDRFLDTYRMNITYPDDTLLGEFDENITLTPSEMTQEGEYTVNIFANDTSGNEITRTESFTVMNDTEAPVVTLERPEDVSIIGTNMVSFDYHVDDLNDPDSCTLYVQKMNIIYDPVGGIIHKEGAGPWEPVRTTGDATLGKNTFTHGPLGEDSYSWNVQCTDLAGNTAMAEKNRTFRVLERAIHLDVPEYPLDNLTFIEDEPADGYSLDAKIYPIEAKTNTRVNATLELTNTGEMPLYDVSFLSSNDWVFFEEGVAILEPGNTTNVTISMQTPRYPDRFMYHVGISAHGIRKLATGRVETFDASDIPLRIHKRVYSLDDDTYNISLTLRNHLERPLKIYLEESLVGMDDVIFSDDQFHTTGTDPPYVALARTHLDPGEKYEASYTAEHVDFDKLTESLVMVDTEYEYTMEIVSPHNFNILLYRSSYVEIILISLTFVLIISMVLLYYMYKRYQIEKLYR
ncbi:MAG: hypothetical protein ACLFSL_01060 [Candidatus Woesearchaeota archaeon]